MRSKDTDVASVGHRLWDMPMIL